MKEEFIPPHPLNTPVLFLIFNRPDTTKQVFEEIRLAKPPRLYIASDGPRLNQEGEDKLVNDTRNLVLSSIDWRCDVKTLFRDKNLGCKQAVSTAITWFFEHENKGIILEDDCLPSQSFFWFCEELLERYENDMRIMIISGYNKQNVWKYCNDDYFFSFFGGIWGWATWKRAWSLYDGEMKSLDIWIKNQYFECIFGKKIGKIRKEQFLNIVQDNVDSWAFPWGFARHKNFGLACVPRVSLIENIGFGLNATHTKHHELKPVCRNDLCFPIQENSIYVPDIKYDILFLKDLKVTNRIYVFLSRMKRLIIS